MFSPDAVPLRRVVFWAHLACGLSAGLVILMMSITGVLLTYQKQMTEWSDREYWVAPASKGRAPISEIVRSAQAWDPDATISAIVLQAGSNAPVAATLGRSRTLYLDPSTGAPRGENNTRMRAFFSIVMQTHRWFNIGGEGRAVARAVTGWSNLVFLFLVMSGLYLWFPRRWTLQHFRPILTLNRTLRGKARDFNWHHVFGFWTSIPLALVVASATVISFPWASDMAYRFGGDDPPQRSAPAAVPPAAGGSVRASEAQFGTALFDLHALDVLPTQAAARFADWRKLTILVPSSPEALLEVRVETGWGGQPQKRHTIRYSGETGNELEVVSSEDQSRGRRFRTFLRFAHTGEYFGLVGQTVAGLVTLFSVILVWSGFALAWRRLASPLMRGASGRTMRKAGLADPAD